MLFSNRNLFQSEPYILEPIVNDQENDEEMVYNFFKPLVSNCLTNVLNPSTSVWDTLHGVCEDLFLTT